VTFEKCTQPNTVDAIIQKRMSHVENLAAMTSTNRAKANTAYSQTLIITVSNKQVS